VLRRLWNERVAAPVTASLRQGLTPERIALSLALVLPLVRLGERLTGAAPATFWAAPVVGSTSAEPLRSLERFAAGGLHGILGWTALLPIVVLVVYQALLPLLRAAEARLRPSGSGAADPPDAVPSEAR
jgi:hypothetical protein